LQALVETGETSCQQLEAKPFLNLAGEVAEFKVVEEPCSLLAQFQKTLANPEIVTDSLKKEEEPVSEVATRFIKPKGTPRRQ